MENLTLYNALRVVPDSAKRGISAGRLKGKTDINPMWRIKALTEQFGPCGIGWKYTITEKRLERGAKDEIAAFLDINLYVKIDGQWSDAIPGTGGSAFVASERNGLYTSDECFKMALTDAISVACKALGMGADVYWDKDKTKYTGGSGEEDGSLICEVCKKAIKDAKNPAGEIWKAKDISVYTKLKFNRCMCVGCYNNALKQSKMDAGQ